MFLDIEMIFYMKMSQFESIETIYNEANLQTIKADVNGSVKKILVCTSCLKANKVKKVV